MLVGCVLTICIRVHPLCRNACRKVMRIKLSSRPLVIEPTFRFKRQPTRWSIVQIFDQLWVALVVAVIGYAALFGIKYFTAGVILCLPLLLVLWLFRKAVKATFADAMDTLPLHAAADLDRADQVRKSLGQRVLVSFTGLTQRC